MVAVPENLGGNKLHIVLTGNTTFKLANFRNGLIRELIQLGHRVSVLSPRDEHVASIQSLGCDYVEVPMDRNGTSLLSEASLLLRLGRHLRAMRPNAVFSYTIKNNIYCGIVCRMLGIPFVPNVTGLGPAFNRRGVLNTTVRLLYRISFKKAHTVFFQNDADLDFFTSAGLSAASASCLLPGSGVDLNHFAQRPLPDAEDGRIRFLLVSRLLWDKGIGHYVDAARLARQRHPQARFQLLGPIDSDSYNAIKPAQIEAWVAEGIIEYLGSTTDVRPFLASAHCIVLPSFYREGTPRALLEACAVGRPLITTDTPGCRDVVKHGVNGLKIAPSDVGELAEAFNQIVDAPHAQREKMAQASRSLAEAQFDERLVIAAYTRILENLRAQQMRSG